MHENKVLVINENHSENEYLRNIFEAFKLHSFHVDSIMKAKAYLQDKSYNIIFTDVSFNKKIRVDFIKLLSKLNDTARIVIVADTLPSPALVELINAGIYRFIPRPMNGDAIKSAVADIEAEEQKDNYRLRTMRKDIYENILIYLHETLSVQLTGIFGYLKLLSQGEGKSSVHLDTLSKLKSSCENLQKIPAALEEHQRYGHDGDRPLRSGDVRKVLVIDDEKNILEFFTSLLDTKEYSVFPCSSGEEGLAVFEENDFDTVFLDIKLPGIGGLEVLKAIRLLNRNVRIIIISGLMTKEMAKTALQLGANSCILKPFGIKEIMSHLQ